MAGKQGEMQTGQLQALIAPIPKGAMMVFPPQRVLKESMLGRPERGGPLAVMVARLMAAPRLMETLREYPEKPKGEAMMMGAAARLPEQLMESTGEMFAVAFPAARKVMALIPGLGTLKMKKSLARKAAAEARAISTQVSGQRKGEVEEKQEGLTLAAKMMAPMREPGVALEFVQMTVGEGQLTKVRVARLAATQLT